MIKKLFIKEIKLTVPLVSFMFVLLAGLLLIPSYPYVVSMSYILSQVQIVFTLLATNKDVEFTSMLPVSRKQVVQSKFITMTYIQGVQILVAVPFALISSLVLNKGGNPVGMDANFAFFGLVFIYYSVFNAVFLPNFFKTGYKWGVPILKALLFYVLTVAAFESLIALVPALKSTFDSLSPSTFIYQIILLVAGLGIYVGSMVLSYKRAVKNFEKVSL